MFVYLGFLVSIDKNGNDAFVAASTCQGFGTLRCRAGTDIFQGWLVRTCSHSGGVTDSTDTDDISASETCPFIFSLI